MTKVAVEASAIRVSGHVGGSVKIQCSHLFADTNMKYFCRDPCKEYQHILIKSGQSPTGRYKLKDLGNGDFTVTITDLQKSDAGTYWCGVTRYMKDSYRKVLLTITDGSESFTVYDEAARVQTEVNQPNRSSSSTESHETLENPLYSTVDLKESLDLTIHSTAL
ncbi:hypothetical protein AOLI_G00234800 [Acnodon oligacanthus]